MWKSRFKRNIEVKNCYKARLDFFLISNTLQNVSPMIKIDKKA